MRARESEPDVDFRSGLATKTERSSRPDRRVDTGDLLSAYGNTDFRAEAQQLRNPATPPVVAAATPTVFIPAAQRAAETSDIPGALQKELESVNAGKTYDYQLAKALVSRWMKEDAAACAAWLGQMKMRGGWGDPFNAFAETLPPLELLGLMDGWLQVNRRLALSSLAERMGKVDAAALPAILSRLGDQEAKAFLENAASYARVEDAAVWLTVSEDDPTRLTSLAGKWIQGPGTNWEWRDGEWVPSSREMMEWRNAAEPALAAAAGTPAEEVFQQQWEKELRRSETGRELARVAREPAEAAAALVALHMAEGHDEAEARKVATEEIAQSYRDGLEDWQRESWEQELQLSLLGRQSLEEALVGRLEAIESSLPEVLRSGTLSRSWRDAMTVDPAATLEVAQQRGQTDEAVRVAAELVRNPETSLPVRAEILGLLADQGLWKQDGVLPNVVDLAREYLRDDPEGARVWLKRLPATLSNSIKEVAR